MAKTDMDRELKKGSTELLILSLLEARARHGYDIGRQIERKSQGVVALHVASLYPLLYRLERRGGGGGGAGGGGGGGRGRPPPPPPPPPAPRGAPPPPPPPPPEERAPPPHPAITAAACLY